MKTKWHNTFENVAKSKYVCDGNKSKLGSRKCTVNLYAYSSPNVVRAIKRRQWICRLVARMGAMRNTFQCQNLMGKDHLREEEIKKKIYGLDDRGSIPGWARASCAHTIFSEGFSPGIKRPGREANKSPGSRASRNAWSYTSTHSWCLIEQRDEQRRALSKLRVP
jgi:hypothetical protein